MLAKLARCRWMVLFLAAAPTLDAEEKAQRREPVTSADRADADFAVQGEYRGKATIGGQEGKLGVQVIARSGGKFLAVGYRGGLPGDGWDRGERVKAEGSTQGEEAVFPEFFGTASIRDGVLAIKDAGGKVIGKLERVVRKSPTLGKEPPEGAVVLFDGKSAEAFERGRMTEDRLLRVPATSKRAFGGSKVHLEFKLPYMPWAGGQNRGNSGCYLQGRYEAQILDSFGLEGKNNECGGIYSVKDPELNLCFPPLSWQTYDIEFTAAVFDDSGKKVKNPRMTVYLNGVLVQKDVEIPRGETTAAPVKEGPGPGPLFLQDHGSPVLYRNIWVVETK